jgi:hypothetical protein
MLKTLTMTLGLAAALGVCSVSKAGGWFDKDDDVKTVGFGLSSAQSTKPSAQCLPSLQCAKPSAQCLPSPQCSFKFCNPLPGLCSKFSCFCARIKPPCPTVTYEWVLKKKICWTPPCILPSAQCSPQSKVSSPQGSTYGSYPASSGQMPAGQAAPAPPEATEAPAPTGDQAPKAPEAPAPAPTATPAPAGVVAPPPVAPVVPSPSGTSSLLFSSPAGTGGY